MGGPIAKEDIALFSFELPISQLRHDLDSNVVPIGKVQTGIYYHRALLFKVRLRVKRLFESRWNTLKAGKQEAFDKRLEIEILMEIKCFNC